MDPRMRLGKYFILKEFTDSAAAAKLGLNQLDHIRESDVANIRLSVHNVLDPLREAVQAPVRVTSGWRMPAVNTYVQGSLTSDHATGRAADIDVAGMTGERLAAILIQLGVPFKQVIWYAEENGGHVHVSYHEGRNRGEILYSPRKKVYLKQHPRGV